jgi:hypothetical protein
VTDVSVSRRDATYRTQRDAARAEADVWRKKFFRLAAGIVAEGRLDLLDLLDPQDAEQVRVDALRLLERVE